MKKRIFAVLLSISLLMTGTGTVFAEEVSTEAPAVIEGTIPADASSSALRHITGFVPLTNEEQSLTFPAQSKPSVSDLVSGMPKALSVYYDGSTTAEALPVTWESVGEDYTTSDSYYFQFSPKWDESVVLADGLELYKDAPYISVFLTDEPVALRSSVVSEDSVTVSSQALGASISSTEKANNQVQIYRYLTSVMGFNCAAACGVLANIQAESSFNQTATGDNGTSYGICQWHNTRWTDLKNYCTAQGLDWTTLDGQLKFLNYELNKSYPTILRGMKSRGNTAEDAYLCGAYWCETFERPANAKAVGVTRGNLAMNTYFPKYSTGAYDGTYTSPGNTTSTTTPTTPSTSTTTLPEAPPVEGGKTYESGDDVVTPEPAEETTTPEPAKGPVYQVSLTVNQKMDITAFLNDQRYLTYRVSPAGYASVTSGGVLTAKKVSGSAPVTVTGRILQNGAWVDSPASVELSITKPYFSVTRLDLVSTDTANANDYLVSETAPDSWMSSNEKVATVSADGQITPLTSGTTRITAVFGENTGYAAKYSFSVRIGVPALNKKKATIQSGTSTLLSLKVFSRTLTPSYSSSNEQIATVDESGRVYALSEGTATITATYNGQPFTSQITVKKPTLSAKSMTLRAGAKRKLSLRNTKLTATDWTSSNPGVAYVNEAGYVIAVSPGEARISTATGGCTDECVVTVR